MKLLAHAKLNLFLEVTGKRENGYHELSSQVIFLDLADEIEVRESSEIKILGAKIEDNILLKTANLLKNEYAPELGAEFILQKNIPLGAGLGGGSADAAAALFALNKIWKLNLPIPKLYEIALHLGADVPVCLYSLIENTNSAFFEGIGEKLSASNPIKPYYYLLVNPNKPLITKEVFSAFDNYPSSKTNSLDFFIRNNDLEKPAITLMPEIEQILTSIRTQENCLLARMTGSGATCFGVFDNLQSAENAALNINKTWWTKICKPKQIA